jgi:PHP family Zn ribbon phosphoesterase
MPIYKIDLHVHTVLSPCAEVEMIPPLIISRALEVGLDMIGITDHNSAENVISVIEAAEGAPLKVLPGIECESVEGVHLICLFDRIEEVLAMQECIYSALPNLPNRPEVLGTQFVVDPTGDFIRYNERLLLAPTTLTIEQISNKAKELGGFIMPAHVDRASYGIYGVLGFLPPRPKFRAVEISRHTSPDKVRAEHADLMDKTIFQSSDAHRLEELGTAYTEMELNHRTVDEIKLATENTS